MRNKKQLEVLFTKLYNGSWYTIIGVNDIEEWKSGMKFVLKNENIGEIQEFESFTGEEMNYFYNLKGEIAYDDNLKFLAFSLDCLNIAKLAMFKLTHGDRWFDDIVDNNTYHMQEVKLCEKD